MSAQSTFIQTLAEISQGPARPQRTLAKLVSAFLQFGSETDDNLNCAKHVTLSPFKQISGHRAIGLTLSPSNVQIADIVSTLECDRVVQLLEREFPKLSQA